MDPEYLSPDWTTRFIEFCHRHGDEHDSSFLPEANFRADEKNPTFILRDNQGIKGAASLMFEGFETIGKARFRILYTTEPNEEEYRALITRMLPMAQQVTSCFAFIPEHQTLTRQIWETLGFTIERYAFVLTRSLNNVQSPLWPAGYTIRAMQSGEEGTYADVLNSAFENELGRYNKTAEDIKALQSKPNYLPGSLQLLFHDAKAIGILATSLETSNNKSTFWIDTIGLLPDYQGLRLGRQLLREGCQQALTHNVHSIELSVQAQNENAAELYLSEGFEKIETMICYEIDPKKYSKE